MLNQQFPLGHLCFDWLNILSDWFVPSYCQLLHVFNTTPVEKHLYSKSEINSVGWVTGEAFLDTVGLKLTLKCGWNSDRQTVGFDEY